jgi:uncharacterized protein
VPTINSLVHTDRSGVSAIGNATIRVAPDNLTIVAILSHWDEDAKQAYAGARQKCSVVQDYLTAQKIRGSTSARIALLRGWGGAPAEKRSSVSGISAKARFTIKVSDLDRLDELMTGLIDAGIEEFSVITYQSSLLKEIKNDACRQAIASAREKAELFCRETGLSLGRVLAIEEIVNPPQPKQPQMPALILADERDPAEISVSANVAVLFEIARDPVD